MKIIKLFLVVFALSGSLFSYGQQDNHTKILGTWSLVKFEFTTPMEDSASLIEIFTGMQISFEKENKVIMKQKQGNEVKVIRSGTYTLSEDGKSLYQNNEEAEILILNEEELVVKDTEGGVIIHLKRVRDLH